MLKKYAPIAIAFGFAAFMAIGTYIACDESTHSKNLKQNNMISASMSTPDDGTSFEHRILSASTTTAETGEGNSKRFNDGQMVIIFIFGGLLIGGITRELTKKIGLPYAPSLLILTVCLGTIWKSTSWIGEVKQYMSTANPELVLAIFIVPIVFEAAFNTNGYIMRKSWWQVFVLSFPSALGCSFLYALVFRYCFWYKEEMDWDHCIVFGTLLAFTDPVSIGELLRSLKAPLRFKTLLEAESHFTDGSVFVLFSVALHSVAHSDFGWGNAIVRFIQLALGGPGMGIAFAIPTHMWLKKVRLDTVTGVIITVFSAYICFFVSEFVLHVSGILAVEFFGLYISIYTKQHMNERFEHAIHETWATIVSSMETLLYVLAGSYIGVTAVNKDISIHSDDVWKMFMFYFYVYAIRFFVLSLCWPLIRMGNHSFNFRELLGFTWGGIRGVMSIIFAMLVAFDVGAGGERFRDLCIYFTAVTVVMSMLINRTTIVWVLEIVGVSRSTSGEKKWKTNCEKELVAFTNRHFEAAKKSDAYNHADWSLVGGYVGLKDMIKSTLETVIQGVGGKEKFDRNKQIVIDSQKTRKGAIKQQKKNEVSEKKEISQAKNGPVSKEEIARLDNLHQELVQEVRHRVYSLFTKIANERKELFLCPHQTFAAIDEIVSHCQDNVYVDIDIIEYAHYEEPSSKWVDWLISMSKVKCIGYPFKRMAFDAIRDSYLLYWNLEAIMTEVHHELDKALLKTVSFQVRNDSHDPYSYAIEEVMVELDNDFEYVQSYVEEIRNKQPEVIEFTQTQLAGFMMLDERSKVAKDMRDKGAFTYEEWHDVESESGKLFRKVNNNFPEPFEFGSETSNVSLQFPLMRCMSEDQKVRLGVILDMSKKTYAAGKVLVNKGETDFTNLLFIREGFLEESWGGFTTRKRGAGFICGKANVCNNNRTKWYTTLSTYADIPCVVSEVSKENFMKFMQENKELEEDLFQGCFSDFVHIMDEPMDFNPCYRMSEKDLNQVAQHAEYKKVQAGEKISMPYGGFVSEGQLRRLLLLDGSDQAVEHQFEYKYNDMSFILPNYCVLQATRESDVMIFESPVFAHNWEECTGDFVEIDISHLTKGNAHKSKYHKGGDAFDTGDMSVPLGTGENSKHYMQLAKEALINDEYAVDAVTMIEHAGFHGQEQLDDTHKMRTFDQVTSRYMHRTIWGQHADEKGLGNRWSMANYDNLRRMQNKDTIRMYNQSFQETPIKMDKDPHAESHGLQEKSPIGPKYRV